MQIEARVRNGAQGHAVAVRTDATVQGLAVTAKANGRGSAINGGEFLMLALATCYCNDLYREADRLGIVLDEVEVEASGHFDGRGLAARDVRYRARVRANAPASEIERLLAETDAVAEIHNTVRTGAAVQRVAWDDNSAG